MSLSVRVRTQPEQTYWRLTQTGRDKSNSSKAIKKPQSTIRYEPYPTIVVDRNRLRDSNKVKTQPSPDEELEEGEILENEGEVKQVVQTNTNRLSSKSIERQDFVQHVRQLTPINELCPTFCATGTYFERDEHSQTSLSLSLFTNTYQAPVHRSVPGYMIQPKQPSAQAFL